MCPDKENTCGPDERRSLLHGEPLDPGASPGPEVREAWHPELAGVRNGPFAVPVPPVGKWRIRFMSDGPFTVYATDREDQVKAVLGPSSTDGRQLVIGGPIPGASSLTVTADDATMVSWTYTDYCRKHSPDQTPVAIHVDNAPDSMEDMVKRMIQTEFSKWAEKRQHGSFEEEDDFDVPDEDDWAPTAYEFTEMVEETLSEPGPPIGQEAPDPAPEKDSEPPPPEVSEEAKASE